MYFFCFHYFLYAYIRYFFCLLRLFFFVFDYCIFRFVWVRFSCWREEKQMYTVICVFKVRVISFWFIRVIPLIQQHLRVAKYVLSSHWINFSWSNLMDLMFHWSILMICWFLSLNLYFHHRGNFYNMGIGCAILVCSCWRKSCPSCIYLRRDVLL